MQPAAEHNEAATAIAPGASASPRTVLNIVHYPVFGGPHNRMQRLAEPLGRRGWRTIALLPDEPGNAAERLRAGGVPVLQIPLGRLRTKSDPRRLLRYALDYPSDVLRLRRLILESRADIVLIGGLVNAQAAVAARLCGVPVIWQIVDSRVPAVPARLFMAVVKRLATVVMFNGEAIGRLHGGPDLGNTPTFVYVPPVDTHRFAPSTELRTATRAALGVPESAPLVGMVANINPVKGIEYFVRAAALIYRSRPDAWFVVVGPFYRTHSAYTARVLDEVRRSGVPPERIIFTGARDDVHALYSAFDVKLITSVPRSEGTTTTALEAMSSGVPVVATRVGAVGEVVADGVTGLLAPSLDVEAIAGATLRLLGDPELRACMGAAGRRRALERFDVEVCARTHDAAFRAVVARGGRAVHATTGEVLTAPDGTSAPRPDRPALDRSKRESATAPNLDGLRALLRCPACHGEPNWGEAAVACPACYRRYPIVDGIPHLLLFDHQPEHDEVDHQAHARGQAAYFDRAEAEEFEIERPRGDGRLYHWIIDAKLRRSMASIQQLLPGATVANVCGGSGMEAEYLCRQGAAVLVLDVSAGAVRRAAERARRHGITVLPVVADALRLPLADGAVDIAFVHDGLHHVSDPTRALGEMLRVARRAISVTEPARAAGTTLAVRLGMALEQEAAGNRVARLAREDVAEALRRAGFAIVRSERYALYYQHRAGPVSRLCSLPLLFQASTAAWWLINRVAARWGNKLVVVGVKGEG